MGYRTILAFRRKITTEFPVCLEKRELSFSQFRNSDLGAFRIMDVQLMVARSPKLARFKYQDGRATDV